MKRKLNRLLASLLCVLMLSSEFSGLMPRAQAAPAGPDALSGAAAMSREAQTGGSPKEFDVDENGRPNLFVHFLGDNDHYIYDAGGVNAGITPKADLPVPAPYDQSKLTNPDLNTDPAEIAAAPMDNPANTWSRYKLGDMPAAGDNTIFWVGLGIDRREVFELLKDNKGLTSLEAGFYYDERYVEPYVDASGSFKTTIEKANINNTGYPSNTQWSADYEILRAETDMPTATDMITQEEISSPGIYEILTDTQWKMTYVSLELKDMYDASAKRRLAGAYTGVYGLDKDADGNLLTPESAHGTGMQNAAGDPAKNDYQYLLLIPFRLKRYGYPDKLAIRLARNATHFSLGAGQEGADPYAAWEKVTTRNPGKDIKLLTRFNGDLFLFGNSPNTGEVEYSATLFYDNFETVLNYAELSVNGDPALWPVKVTENLDTITGLRSGIGMRVQVFAQSGYAVTMTVKYKNQAGDGYIIHSYQTIKENEDYTFVIPEIANLGKNIEVHLGFSKDDPNYHVFLSELNRDAIGALTTATKLGNATTITTNVDSNGAGVIVDSKDTSHTIHSYDAPYPIHPAHPAGSKLDPHGLGPMAPADRGNQVRINVETHADYMAVVRIGNYNTTGSLRTATILSAAGDPKVETDTTSPNYGKITLPYGGLLTLTMPGNDLDVEVTYQPAPKYKATLEVYHDGNKDITPLNTAQLIYHIYDDANIATLSRSGVVYHQARDTKPTPPIPEDHRAVKTGADNKVLPWVSASEAEISKSLGGDTDRAGQVWNPKDLPTAEDPVLGVLTVMTQLCMAPTWNDFEGVLTALDLNRQQVGTAWVGFRRNEQGQGYGKAEVERFAMYLWELRTRIMNDATLKAQYEKAVTGTVNGASATLYSYLDLSPAQAQAYVLDILDAQEIGRINRRQYDLAMQEYLRVKALRDAQAEKETINEKDLEELKAPTPPKDMPAEADANGIRKYQDSDYQNYASGSDKGYLYKYYEYLNSYRAYINAVAEAGSTSVTAKPSAVPTVPSMKTIPLRPDDASAAGANAKLTGYSFLPNPVGNSPTIMTRDGRTVWVAAEGDSAYYVQEVRVYEANAANQATNLITTATQDTNYANLWYFTMPQKKNCIVRVIYAKRATRNLYVQIIGADGQADNLASVEAYRYKDHDKVHYPYELQADVKPVKHVISNAGFQSVSPYPEAPNPATGPDPRSIYNVFMDTRVTIKVKVADGYYADLNIENLGRGDGIRPDGPFASPDPAEGDIFYFVVEDTYQLNDDVSIIITFKKKLDMHDAYTHDHYLGTDKDSDNEALWRIENPPGTTPPITYTNFYPNVYEGTALVADVTVKPGYYIVGVVARGGESELGMSGPYPCTFTGNGYNNGLGTIRNGVNEPVKIYVDMPNEDLHVDVYYKKGPPDPEPYYPLTLMIKDPDNKDKTAANWAEATVYDSLDASGNPVDQQFTLGKLRLQEDNGDPGKLIQTDFAQRGQWVRVNFGVADGYYVSKVTVGPSNLGVAIDWDKSGDNSFSFFMPAGATSVCVEFAKGKAVTPALMVSETWFDLSTNSAVTGAEARNYVTTVNSHTISNATDGWNPGSAVSLRPETNPDRVPVSTNVSATGAAAAGEEVTMTYIVDDPNWFVQSIILFSDGAAKRLTDDAVEISAGDPDYPTGVPAGCKVYKVVFRMPSTDAYFTIHYRKGPKDPVKNDYAFTMVLYDSDNTDPKKKDDNRLTATFTDAVGGTGVHRPLELGLATYGITNDVRHIHPGDIVTLETMLQPGYSVDYLIINPANLSLYPSWQSVTTDASGVTKGVARFTMPNQGVAVVARYIKAKPHQYTADLILRPPAGCKIEDVGQGTFTTPTGGTLTDYPKKAVYSTAQAPGTSINYDLFAKDGYYISKVTVEPKVGATATLTGSFRAQNGGFVMPAADVYVNVWFEKGWPDEAKYGLSLEVHDAANRPDNWAKFRSAGATDFTTDMGPGGNGEKVTGGQSKTIWGVALDRDIVVLDINTEAKVPGDPAKPGFYYDASTISITDTQGNIIPWWYVPGGIAFTMPPRTTKVVVTFKDDTGDRPEYKADLVVIDNVTGKPTPAEDDEVKLEALSAAAVNSPLTANGTITKLHSQDILELTARPGTKRHIASVYAVYTVGGDTYTVPIYADGALTAPPALAQYIPGDPAAAVKGQFSMPAANVTVYVKFADKEVLDTNKWVALKVSGPKDAGKAEAVIEETVGEQAMTVYTPGGAPAGGVNGMDSRITSQGRPVTVTFTPTDNSPAGKKYDIVKLEVYDVKGNPVPYEWISMVPDPDPLTDTSMWPNPVTDPSPGIKRPTMVKNPLRQIKLNVPVDNVTIHVTYGEIDLTKTYTAQIVVNDPYPAGVTPDSENDAWFGLTDVKKELRDRLRTAKPGEWIDLSVSVHPGYMVEYIKVVPQSYGIAPGLVLGNIYTQNTGFYMPDGDCVVYVKFTKDPTPTKVATLALVGTPVGNNSANYGHIHSPISGKSAAVVVGGSRSVQARPSVDWITVDYYWAAGNSIASISVQTNEGGTSVDIPYTQNEDPATRHGQIVLPMAAKDVMIIITYKDDPTPVGQQVVLHVIDKDRKGLTDTPPSNIRRDPDGVNSRNYARLKAVYAVGADTYLIGPDTAPLLTDPYESTATILVPAGERVDLTACSDAIGLDGNGKVWIESAYVLYEAGGQMLNMNLQPDSATPPPYGFSGKKEGYFIVHQGRNDVYVTLTREEPVQNEYSAVLMLKGPVDNSGQAGICVGSNYETAPANRRDKLTQANHGHAYVTAKQGEGITINVIPAEGYVIDYIQVTPLGYPLSYTYLLAESTIHFDMPHCNIAITVYLKKAENESHDLVLHYLQDTGNENLDDYAKISWTMDDGNKDEIWAWKKGAAYTPPGADSNGWLDVRTTQVKAGATVTLWATLDKPDAILAAYVLSEGELVPLTPTFPTTLTQSTGLEGVEETASDGDNTKADALATFDMPNAKTHVYLITTTDKPEPGWHTIILTASDYSPAGNDLGRNKGYLNEYGKPDSARKTVVSDGGISHAILSLPEYKDGVRTAFTVDTEPGPSYKLNISRTHMVKNVAPNTQNLIPEGTTPTVHYKEWVGNCNKVVHLVFESLDDLTLTVEIDDPDNPGNGTVTNSLNAVTAGVDPLALSSYSIAGSYQIMSGVTAGADVTLTVTPNAGYSAYAILYKSDGSDPEEVPLAAIAGGKLTGTFEMPPNAARVVVTFYANHKATLVLRDNTADRTTQAKMTATKDQFVRTATATLFSQSSTIQSVPNGALLAANMVDFDPADPPRKVTGLLTVNGSTTFLPAINDNGVDTYQYTVNRNDPTITLVVDDKGGTNEEYIAAVQIIGRPDTLADADLPTIGLVPADASKVAGSIWTTAAKDNTVKVTITVPAGYKAEVTTDSALDLDGVAGTTTKTFLPTDTDFGSTFTMPAKNVLVTVKYIKTAYRLTLHVTDTSAIAGNKTDLTPAAGSTLTGQPTALSVTGNGTQTYYTATTTLTPGGALDLKAVPKAQAAPAASGKIKYIFYQVDGGAPIYVNVNATIATAGFDSTVDPGFLATMPAGDVDVTVVYGTTAKPKPTDPDPDDYLIARTEKLEPDGSDPGNQIISIQNTARNTLLDGVTPLPGTSPYWTAGYAEDTVLVSYVAAPGYYVQVYAITDDSTPVYLPVVQEGTSYAGTATTAFPNPGKNVTIQVIYTTTKPTYPTRDVALQLVEHEIKKGNKAETTDFTTGLLLNLNLAGDSTSHAPGYPTGVASKDPVEIQRSKATTGDDLRTLANWADGYEVVRMTIAVRTVTPGKDGKPDTITETGEIDLPISRYGGKATSRVPVPTLAANQIPVVRVYYGNIYQATLHVVGASIGYDITEATDERLNPVTSTGDPIIKNTGDKLLDYRGGEQVRTTAKPDLAGVSGKVKRLVGVVYESDLTGAMGTTSTVADRYDFNMPEDNVDFYVVYEDEPDDPDDRSYIAKVALTDDSEPIAGTGNALSIRNANDTSAAKGKYWVAAKGGNSIVINVKVAQGYKAEVVYTVADDAAVHTVPFDYYIDRVQFYANLNDGKDATFTMPVQSDATVYIRYTKGYDLTLTMTDATTVTALTAGTDTDPKNGGNESKLTVAGIVKPEAALMGGSDALGNVTVAGSKKDVWVPDGTGMAELIAVNTGGSASRVNLYPKLNPGAVISQPGQVIENLPDGTELYLELIPETGWGVATLQIDELTAGVVTGSVTLAAPANVVAGTAVPTYKLTLPAGKSLSVSVTFASGAGMPLPFTAGSAASPLGTVRRDSDTLSAMPGGQDLDVRHTKNRNNSTTDPGDNVKETLTYYSPFSGTITMLVNAAATAADTIHPSAVTYQTKVMDYADAELHSHFYDENSDQKWKAQVRLKGFSDVNGNDILGIRDLTDQTGTWHDSSSPFHTTGETALPVADRNKTTTGNIFTTTDDTGHTIDMSLTVASGYVAKIKVVRDDSMYDNKGNLKDEVYWVALDAWTYEFEHDLPDGKWEPCVSDPAPSTAAGITQVERPYETGYPAVSIFTDSISGKQHFYFAMPTAIPAVGTPGDPGYKPAVPMTDVTVIVEFEKLSSMPMPFDPDNQKMDKIDLERGFIYGENRSDFAVIEIPTLYMEKSGEKRLYDTDNYDTKVSTPPVIHDTKKAADTAVSRYIFALYDYKTETYTDLVEGTDIMLVPYDEETLADKKDLYNYILGMYEGYEELDDNTSTKRKFVGSKFLLLPKPKEDGTFTTNGKKVYDMLNNNGSLEKYTKTTAAVGSPGDPDYKPATSETRWRTTLWVMAEDAAKRQSDYAPVWIRPWFAVGVNVVSYGPTHDLTGELYRFMEDEELNIKSGYYLTDADGKVQLDAGNNPVTNTDPTKGAITFTTADQTKIGHYKWDKNDEAEFTDHIVLEDEYKGSARWLQFLRIRSSELLGPFRTDYDPSENFTAATPTTLLSNVKPTDNLTYALQIKKASNLTYTRVMIDLNPYHYTGTDKLADFYQIGAGNKPDASTRTFMIQDTIQLIAGDVNGDGKVKFQDYDAIYDFVYRNRPWSMEKAKPTEPAVPYPGPGGPTAVVNQWEKYYAAVAEWNISVYNPDTWAYRADLDGNHRLSIADADIIRTAFNYNRTEADYQWRKKVSGSTVACLPYGLGAKDNSYSSLFAVGMSVEGEQPEDAYWDALMDVDDDTAVPMLFWVDDSGRPWLEDPWTATDDADVTDGTDGASGTEGAGSSQPAAHPGRGERVEIPLGEEVQGSRPANQPQANIEEDTVEVTGPAERPTRRPTGSDVIDITDVTELTVDEPARAETARHRDVTDLDASSEEDPT